MLVHFTILLLIGNSVNAQALFTINSERLPGLKELEAGFDAMSMSSVADKQSRFRIFDLSATGPKRYKFSVLGRHRTYKVPPFVQVTNIQQRRDIAGEDISTDYRYFYSK